MRPVQKQEDSKVQELKCPDCGYLNPDIRELGYSLPWTCGRCPHIWRLQDLGSIEAPKTKAEALAKQLPARSKTPNV